MKDLYNIDLIIERKKYPKIYNIGLILFALIITFLYIINIYDYTTYINYEAISINKALKLDIDDNDLKYFLKSNKININNKNYEYKVLDYVNLENSTNLYLLVDALDQCNNCFYSIKIAKENKKIIQYIKDYI